MSSRVFGGVTDLLGGNTPTAWAPSAGADYLWTCYDPTTGTLISSDVYNYQPGTPLVTGADLALDASATLIPPTPQIETSPPADRPQVVGLRTWYWLTSAYTTVSQTATAGDLAATVTATPTSITIDPGDGTPAFTCPGPGTPWDPARPDAAPECSHVYQRRSTSGAAPRGTFIVMATVHYDVTWTATTGEAGTLAELVTTGQRALTVHEIQAVIN